MSDGNPLKRILPGDTGEDPFAAFDEAKETERVKAWKRVAAIDAALDAPLPAQALTHVRGKTHGDFTDHATFTQALKDVMRSAVRVDGSRPWDGLSAIQKESLDMNAHKIGRILAGDPNFKDHWADMAGYSQLVADRLPD